jgi:Nuclear pore protein 84 / 107
MGNLDGITADTVIDRLFNSDHEKIKYVGGVAANKSAESKHPIRVLMGYVITGNINQAIHYVNSLTDAQSNLYSGIQIAFLLRLCVHISLVMRDLNVPHDDDAANEIIRKYVLTLIQYHVVRSILCPLTQDEQIAQYAHHLPRDLGIETYALFLSSIPPSKQD